MATETAVSLVGKIGETAGQVWHALDGQEKMSISRLVRSVDAPRDLVLQAIGWLAREDKIEIEQAPTGRYVSLR